MSNEELVDGIDSGAVPEKIKKQVFVDGIGICAEPECNERIIKNSTTLGECAHIIPRKVGSHPREDYSTPLEDRKKESNLIYLCHNHHRTIDDVKHATYYTSAILRQWKKNHESWASNIHKDALNTSSVNILNFDKLISTLSTTVTDHFDENRNILDELFDGCKDLIDRNLLDIASLQLSHIESLLIDFSNSSLNSKKDYLEALMLIKSEKVKEAKLLLLEIVRQHPTYIEPMLEYIDLCELAPNDDDELVKIESLASSLDGDNLKLQLIRYSRFFQIREIPDKRINIDDLDGNDRLRGRLLCIESMFSDIENNEKQRDKFINDWEALLPTSPRPNLFRMIFYINDIFKSEISNDVIDSAILALKNEYGIAQTKDPINYHDEITWKILEMRILLAHKNSFGAEHDLSVLRDDLASLFSRVFFTLTADSNLPVFLGSLRVSETQWRSISRNINKSDATPSLKSVEALFLQAVQYRSLYTELNDFLTTYNAFEFKAILKTIIDKDISELAKLLNEADDSTFSCFILETLNDSSMQLGLIEELIVDDQHRPLLALHKLELTVSENKECNTEQLVSNIDIDSVPYDGLKHILDASYKNNQWDIFIDTALKYIDTDIITAYHHETQAKLAIAYYESGDDSNAVRFAELSLQNHKSLSYDGSRYLLHIIIQSLTLIGSADLAVEKIKKYSFIRKSFPLSIEIAELYLKSSLNDKYNLALNEMINAFNDLDDYNESMFLGVFTLSLDLANAGVISSDNYESVIDGSFVKLSNFNKGWFYIGNDNEALGASSILTSSSNYDAIINRKVGESVDWPAQRFSSKKSSHVIQHIVSVGSYISWRAHEAMADAAEIGDKAIWSIEVLDDNGELNLDNLRKFHEDQNNSNDDFFRRYVTSPIPFALLCKVEHGIDKALGRITTSKKGFIRCNNSTTVDIDSQLKCAENIMNGSPCVIDGLSVLMLSECNLLKPVLDHIQNLNVPASAVRLLRKIAKQFSTKVGQASRSSFVDGEFRLVEINDEQEKSLRKTLLKSADYLEDRHNKFVGKSLVNADNKEDIKNLIPDYFLDSIQFSQTCNVAIITDDSILIQTYNAIENMILPDHCSSISLVRCLAKSGAVTWNEYLNFFSLLSSYRYHLLQITVGDILDTIFVSEGGKVVTCKPKNILALNLPLTLSQEYGVNDDVIVNILSKLFTHVIQDDTIPEDVAEEIISLTINESLSNRDARLLTNAIYQICNNNILNDNWSSNLSKSKLNVLHKQIATYTQKNSPIILL